MKPSKIFILTIIIFLIPSLSFSQITMNPGSILIIASMPSGNFENTSGAQVFVHAEANWKITCLGTALVGAESGHIIPVDRISVKHDYSGGAYQPFNNKIFIAEGGATGSSTNLVNTLFIRITVLKTDVSDEYYGELHFEDDTGIMGNLVIPVQLKINAESQFTLSTNLINLNVTGAPGIYEADNSVQLNVDGNTSKWQIKAKVTGISGPSFVNKSNIFLKSSAYDYNGNQGAGEGFQSLSFEKEILNGAIMGINGNSDISFKLKTNYNLLPGDYLAQIQFTLLPYKQIKTVELHINISKYVEVGFSQGSKPKVNIYSKGPPGEYQSNDPLTLEVAANTNWEASAEAENLKSDRDEIPSERIYLFSSNLSHLGYQSLASSKIIASGPHMEKSQTSNLKIKVETKIDDIAGDYSGKITITIVAIP